MPDGHDPEMDDRALARVLAGAPAPDGDGPQTEAHTAAAADVEKLGRAIRLIGREAAALAGTGEPVAPAGGRRRPGWRSAVAVAAAAVLIVAGIVGIDRDDVRSGPGDGGGWGFGWYLVCTRLTVDGTVVQVVPARPGRLLVTVDVREWIKPAAGPRRIEIDMPDPGLIANEPLRPGRRLIIGVPTDETGPGFGIVDDQEIASARRLIEESRADAARSDPAHCPYG